MSESTVYRNVKVRVQKREPSPFWWLWPILIAAIVIALISFLWLRPKFDSSTADDAVQTLKDKGVSTEGLAFSSSYRDLIIKGTPAAGVNEEVILEALAFKEKGDWNHKIYDVKFELDEAKSALTEPTAIATGPTDVKADINNEKITLTGEVLTEKQKQTIYDAAVKRFGEDNVVNKIRVSALKEATINADGRAAALASVLLGVPKDVTGKATLTDTRLTFDGIANRASDKPAFQSVFDKVTGVEASMNLEVPEVAKQIDTLDEEFKALAAEIQRKVVFRTGSAVLLPKARRTLDKAVTLMKKYTLPVVSINGHTDNKGNPEKNKTLSGKRAQSVVDYLIKKGVKLERLSARGYGDSQPLTANDTAAGRQKNRRVEFIAKKHF